MQIPYLLGEGTFVLWTSLYVAYGNFLARKFALSISRKIQKSIPDQVANSGWSVSKSAKESKIMMILWFQHKLNLKMYSDRQMVLVGKLLQQNCDRSNFLGLTNH